MGTSSFPGVKRPERAIKQLRLSGAEVKEIVELYLHSHSVPSWQDIGGILPLNKVFGRARLWLIMRR